MNVIRIRRSVSLHPAEQFSKRVGCSRPILLAMLLVSSARRAFRALVLFTAFLFVAGQAQAASQLVAGWDFSQSCLEGNLCDQSLQPVQTLSANYSDLDPTDGMGAESADFGTMYVDGQFGSSDVPGLGGWFTTVSPSLTLNTSVHTNYPLVEMGAAGNASIMQSEIPGVPYQQHAIRVSDVVDAVFSVDLTSYPGLLGSDWSVSFAAQSEGSGSEVAVSFSLDGVTYSAPIVQAVGGTEEVITVSLGGTDLSQAFVKLSFDSPQDPARIDNLAILADLPLVSPTPPPVAELDKDQQKCINEMNKNGQKVEKAQLKEIETCLKEFQKGKLGALTFDACSLADRKGKVAKAEAKTLDQEQKKCASLAVPPPFGYTSGAIVNIAAVDGGLALSRDIFGNPVDDADLLLASDPTKDEAKCQLEMLKNANKLDDTILKEANKVKKKALKDGTVSSASDLEDTIRNVFSSNEKILKAEVKFADKVDKKCLGLPTAPTLLFPSICADASLANVEDCVIAAARCEVCLKLNAFDDLSIDCDEADDEVVNGSCPWLVLPPATPTPTPMVMPTPSPTP
jgi:hypothetical protein